MYTLKPFTRVNNNGGKKEVESFVNRVSGKEYSTRDIEILAGAWFKGSKTLKEQVQSGELDWTLRQLKHKATKSQKQTDNLSESQSKIISNLEIVTSVIFKLNNSLERVESDSSEFIQKFRARASKLINMLSDFENTLREFYDRCGQKTGDTDLVSFGQK